MSRTSTRNLLPVLKAASLDTRGKGPNVSDDIQLGYKLTDLERLVPPLRHPHAGVFLIVFGFPLVPPFDQAAGRLIVGPKGVRITSLMNLNTGFVAIPPMLVGITQDRTIGTFGPVAANQRTDWGAPALSTVEQGRWPLIGGPIVNQLLELPETSPLSRISEADLPLPLYPGDLLYFWEPVGPANQLRMTVAWDEPA